MHLNALCKIQLDIQYGIKIGQVCNMGLKFDNWKCNMMLKFGNWICDMILQFDNWICNMALKFATHRYNEQLIDDNGSARLAYNQNLCE